MKFSKYLSPFSILKLYMGACSSSLWIISDKTPLYYTIMEQWLTHVSGFEVFLPDTKEGKWWNNLKVHIPTFSSVCLFLVFACCFRTSFNAKRHIFPWSCLGLHVFMSKPIHFSFQTLKFIILFLLHMKKSQTLCCLNLHLKIFLDIDHSCVSNSIYWLWHFLQSIGIDKICLVTCYLVTFVWCKELLM